MIKASGCNVGNYFAGGTEKSHQPGGRDEVIGYKNQGNYFTVGGSVIGEKSRVAHYNIKCSHLWWTGCYRRTKVHLRYKQRKQDHRFRSPV